MNNKVVLKIVVICLAIFVVFGILTAIFASRMAVTEWDERNVFTVGKGEPFEYHKDANFDLDGVNQININTVSTDVIFYESEEELEITLDCKGFASQETVTLVADQIGSVINAEVKYPKQFWGNINLTESLLTVGIPATYSESIKVNGVSSTVDMDALVKNSFEELDIDTVSGDAYVESVSVETLEFNSTSGDLEVVNTLLGTVYADTTSGNMDISNLSADAKKVDVDTVSGRVNLVYDELCTTHVHTTSGDVYLTIPAGTQIDLDFESVSGDVKGDYNKNSDGVFVEVDTVSGDLTID